MVNQPNDTANHIFKPRIKSEVKVVDPNQLLYAEDLLRYYKFGLDGRSLPQILQHWAGVYPIDWIGLAIVEALYQGRYKVVSVEQILQMWQRREQAQPHFDDDFGQLIRQRLPKNRQHNETPETSAVAELAAEIHAQSHVHSEDSPDASSTLEELTQFVQRRRPRQVGIDAVIDQAEANVNSAAAQAKKHITHEPTPIETTPTSPSKAIGEFTPQTSDSDLMAKLRRSVSQNSDKTAS